MMRPAYRAKNSRSSGTTIEREAVAVNGFVKTTKTTDSILKATRSQRVQRGTNRPSGKRVKTRKNTRKESSPTNKIGNRHAEWLVPTVRRTGIVPPNTSPSAMSNAIQSSDLRQKITPPVPKKAKATRVASTNMNVV